jgi:hypothetical protein
MPYCILRAHHTAPALSFLLFSLFFSHNSPATIGIYSRISVSIFVRFDQRNRSVIEMTPIEGSLMRAANFPQWTDRYWLYTGSLRRELRRNRGQQVAELGRNKGNFTEEFLTMYPSDEWKQMREFIDESRYVECSGDGDSCLVGLLKFLCACLLTFLFDRTYRLVRTPGILPKGLV